ncbi:hypothetical protein V7654_11125 [Bacillus sp. JJ1609]|uniref:hypothetical protein n=1 Tax=Bacillus sp. JJ1609 TaxID=3122977 RepID=UPI003000509C
MLLEFFALEGAGAQYCRKKKMLLEVLYEQKVGSLKNKSATKKYFKKKLMWKKLSISFYKT